MIRPESQEFDEIRRVVAARLREFRQVRGISQEELADLAGCHRTYVGMLERRLGNPSLKILTRIALALNLQVRDLLGPDTA